MNTTVALLLLSVAQTTPQVQELSERLERQGYQKAAVFPLATVEGNEGDRETRDMQPLANSLVDDLTDGLREASDGRVEILSSLIMDSLTDDEQRPGDMEFLRTLAAPPYEVDVLLVAEVTDNGDFVSMDVRPLETDDLTEPQDVSLTLETAKTLGMAAYAGESWELRRWTEGTLTNVGIDLSDKDSFGRGPEESHRQYTSIRSDAAHPLQDPSSNLTISIEVDGAERQVEFIGGQAYVELNPGETYEVSVSNQSGRKVYLGLYIDGMLTVGTSSDPLPAAEVAPDDAPRSRHWTIGTGIRRIKGWYTRDEGADTRPFLVTTGDKSLAGEAGYVEKIGMITAVFHTYGFSEVPEPDDERDEPRLSTRGVGGSDPLQNPGTTAGAAVHHNIPLDQSDTERGLMLSAMTIHYRTADQLEELRGRPASQKLTGGGDLDGPDDPDPQPNGPEIWPTNDETVGVPRRPGIGG